MIASALSAVLTYVGLFFSIRIPLPAWSWWVWFALAIVTTIILLLMVFHAIYRFHVRTVDELTTEYQTETKVLSSQVVDKDNIVSERNALSHDNEMLKSEKQTLQSEKSKQDKEIAELKSKIDQKVNRKYILKRLGEFFDEGNDLQWKLISHQAKATREYNDWLEQVKQFLSKEPEFFDTSHLALFNANPLGALEGFIRDIQRLN